MTSPAPTHAVPLWRRPRVIGTVLLVALIAAMLASTKFIDTSNAEIAVDDAVAYAEENYETVVVSTITDGAQPLDELVAALLVDVDAAGEEFGRREDASKPFSFPVEATGTVTEGGFGEVGFDVDGIPGGITVGLAIPPLGSNSAIRDTGTDLTFNDFNTQTQYQRVAIELNNKVVQGVLTENDLQAMSGSRIRVIGAFTWVSDTGGTIDHVTIIPVQIEADE